MKTKTNAGTDTQPANSKPVEKQVMKVRLNFEEEILGSVPMNKEMYQDWIAAKAESANVPAGTKEEISKEVESVDDQVNKGTTGFLKDDIGVHILNYVIRGFFKENLGVLIDLGQSKISKYASKRVVDNTLWVSPRKIYYTREGKNILVPDGFLERPMSVITMQGPRVCLARSEVIKPPCSLEFTAEVDVCTNEKSAFRYMDLDLVRACLDRGARQGFGQWRSGGKGLFTWEEVL